MQKNKITSLQLWNCQHCNQSPCHHRTTSKFPPPTGWFARCPISILLLTLKHKQRHTHTHVVGWKWLKPLIISEPHCQFPLVPGSKIRKRNKCIEGSVSFSKAPASYIYIWSTIETVTICLDSCVLSLLRRWSRWACVPVADTLKLKRHVTQRPMESELTADLQSSAAAYWSVQYVVQWESNGSIIRGLFQVEQTLQ